MTDYEWLDELDETMYELKKLRELAEQREKRLNCGNCKYRIGVPCIRTQSCPKEVLHENIN